jgi:hypothetical protein
VLFIGGGAEQQGKGLVSGGGVGAVREELSIRLRVRNRKISVGGRVLHGLVNLSRPNRPHRMMRPTILCMSLRLLYVAGFRSGTQAGA